MTARASWRGFLKVAELSCSVGLFAAVSTVERVSFHIVNAATGNRIQRQMVDEETGRVVERDDQVKGYRTGAGKYVVLEPEEIAAAIPESDKTLAVETFIPCAEVDPLYLDRPYYLAPGDDVAAGVFAVIRAGMEARSVAALARTLLFRRMRTLLIRPAGAGMIATTLSFDYEVASAEDAFADVAKIKIDPEMIDLARHIIAKKEGSFDPATFDDRYDAALAAMVKAKLAGKPLPKPRPRPKASVVSLMDALRQSAGRAAPARRRPAAKRRGTASPRRKAG